MGVLKASIHTFDSNPFASVAHIQHAHVICAYRLRLSEDLNENFVVESCIVKML